MVTINIISFGFSTFSVTMGWALVVSVKWDTSTSPDLQDRITWDNALERSPTRWHQGSSWPLLLALPSIPFQGLTYVTLGFAWVPVHSIRPSSSFLNVTTRPPMWSLASRTVIWDPEKLPSFPVLDSPSPTLYTHPHPATGSHLKFPAVGFWMCRLTKLQLLRVFSPGGSWVT